MSSTNPGRRYHQNPPPVLAGSRLSLWRFFGFVEALTMVAFYCLTMLSTPVWYSVPSSVFTSLADFVPLTSSWRPAFSWS